MTGEYDNTGQLIQEILWLGDLPVAVLKPATSTNTTGITGITGITTDLYYIHADHLGTPRAITRPNDNKIVWRWESEAFGHSLPEQNPSGLGEFVFNLRFPGQYYDQETGLFYNYFRDYDPRTGKYIESDPIGLRGGVNTYVYVEDNPVNLIDREGLIENSPSNRAKRDAMSKNAKSHNGSKAWCKACRKDNFPAGTNKCNKFVSDVAEESGADAKYKGRPPLAAEWASPNVDIPDWRTLGKEEQPMPGDVAAYALPSGGAAYSGHTGIMTDLFLGFGLTNSSAHEFEVGPSWNQFEGNSATVYRRYTGE